MTEEIYKNIFRIHVPLKGNPLKELNAYYIKSEGQQLLIDNGFRTEDCYNALTAGLRELGADLGTLDLAVTHLHADHSGNTEKLMNGKNRVYMSETDVAYCTAAVEERDAFGRRLLSEGFLPEWLAAQESDNPADAAWMERPWEVDFIKMNTGDKIRVGEYELNWIVTPGHTPGNSMLYEATHKLMFTGDHILFSITPNITSWGMLPNALGAYLDSLRAVKKYDVRLSFPGHRELADCDYYSRIDEILAHHERRLKQAYDIISESPGLNATEICSRMTWKIRCRDWEDFPVVQKFFAVGETLSHLEYLMAENKITQREHNGLWVYSKR